MTDWRPNYRNADPASAWFGPDELAKQLEDEHNARDFLRMLIRRRRFQEAMARLQDPTPEDRAALWARADEEATNATD